jgi:hypothetical protein
MSSGVWEIYSHLYRHLACTEQNLYQDGLCPERDSNRAPRNQATDQSTIVGQGPDYPVNKVFKVRNMDWLINKKSQLTLENKITIYNAIIRPVWTYGIELWGCSKHSNTKILQTFQSRTLRKLANAPWYISNITLHNDLRMPYVTEVIRTYAKNHKNRTARNNNQLIRDLFNQAEIGRRLNKMWSEDLIREPSEDGSCFRYSHPSLLLITLFKYLD